MNVKSLDELRKIREESLKKIKLRKHGESDNDDVEVLVGMSTCGISSGSRETLNKFIEIINSENVENIKVVPVGCNGKCHSEPTVEVHIPGKEPVLYGNVKEDKVKEIIDRHIKGGEPIKELVLKSDFERV